MNKKETSEMTQIAELNEQLISSELSSVELQQLSEVLDEKIFYQRMLEQMSSNMTELRFTFNTDIFIRHAALHLITQSQLNENVDTSDAAEFMKNELFDEIKSEIKSSLKDVNVNVTNDDLHYEIFSRTYDYFHDYYEFNDETLSRLIDMSYFE